MNEAEAEECKGVRKEEGVAQFEFGIKTHSTMKPFFKRFSSATVFRCCLGPRVAWGEAGLGRALTQR